MFPPIKAPAGMPGGFFARPFFAYKQYLPKGIKRKLWRLLAVHGLVVADRT
jgi:hypothetical protein